MALLTSRTPKDWKDLQEQVAIILKECGFVVYTERTFETVRGSVELDVYAEEKIKVRKYLIACECKHWRSAVPQSVIHSFRTVASDLGINIGYIISSSGFQSGAFTASELTNIKLLNWEEFQEEFCDTWLEKYLTPTITNELETFLDYVEPIVPNWFLKAPYHEKPVLKSLHEKYLTLAAVMMSMSTYGQVIKHEYLKLPLRDTLKPSPSGYLPEPIIDVIGYRDFLDLALEYGKQAVAEFDEIRKRNNI